MRSGISAIVAINRPVPSIRSATAARDEQGGQCWACHDGLTYDTDTDDSEGYVCVSTCEWCDGRSGHDVCLSSVEWCTANPLPGCEEVGRT